MSSTSITDKIEKTITLQSPPSRVWAALADAQSFGAWFGATFDGDFLPGASVAAQSTHPDCSGVRFEIHIEAIEPESRFAFRWHPHAIDPATDYSSEPTTLVEFFLEASGDGTVLRVTESGFDALPASRREQAFRMNEGGWNAQVENIRKHIDG